MGGESTKGGGKEMTLDELVEYAKEHPDVALGMVQHMLKSFVVYLRRCYSDVFGGTRVYRGDLSRLNTCLDSLDTFVYKFRGNPQVYSILAPLMRYKTQCVVALTFLSDLEVDPKAKANAVEKFADMFDALAEVIYVGKPPAASKDETDRRILELRKEGQSIRKISELTGIPKSTVANRIKRLKAEKYL